MDYTNIKGLVTELQCQTYFTQLGYIVSVPLGPQRYDFILDTGKELLKIQVKSCSNTDPATLEFSTKSVHYNKTNGYYNVHYNENEVDYFCTFFENECYLIPFSEIGTSSKKLRLLPTKNGQVKNICFAKDYIAKEVLERR